MFKKTGQLKKVAKNKGKCARLIYALPVLMMCTALLAGASEKAIPDVFYTDKVQTAGFAPQTSVTATSGNISDNIYTAKLFGILPTKTVTATLPSDLYLVPGGDVFGVKFFTKGVVITDMSEVESEEGIICPAKKAGLKNGDVVLSVNGKELESADSLTQHIESCGGKELELEFVRDGKNYKAKLLPVKAIADGAYKMGMWVRDSTAGIGTVTYYNPDDGSFAGLGHGIYDTDTELLLPLQRGAVVSIDLEDVVKGREGHPGELKGSFGSEKCGTVLKNTPTGVFGVLAYTPQAAYDKIACAIKSEVTEGAATILSNVDGKGVKEYNIEIVKIYSGNEETKNFVIEVKDDRLAQLTGGIVRGMSGSPIVQNGKLVGAVTHVFVNDPTRGYGIFIENMLAEARKIK